MNYWVWALLFIANVYCLVGIYTACLVWKYLWDTVDTTPEWVGGMSGWRIYWTLGVVAAWGGVTWPVTLRRLYWLGEHD